MNDERLQTLQARAKQATETAAMLELLKGADPHKAGACVSFTWRGETAELFKESTLKDIIGLGRLEMMKTLEAQLEALLGNSQPAKEPPLTCDHCHRVAARQCQLCMQILCAECEPKSHNIKGNRLSAASDLCERLWPEPSCNPSPG